MLYTGWGDTNITIKLKSLKKPENKNKKNSKPRNNVAHQTSVQHYKSKIQTSLTNLRNCKMFGQSVVTNQGLAS